LRISEKGLRESRSGRDFKARHVPPGIVGRGQPRKECSEICYIAERPGTLSLVPGSEEFMKIAGGSLKLDLRRLSMQMNSLIISGGSKILEHLAH
jgi:hypothetical protein